jgi:hypothetical protein
MNYNQQRGQHHNGISYFCFAGAGQDYLDPMVMAYAHDTDKLSGPVKVGENPLADIDDNHGNPAMIVDALGHLHMAWGGHGPRGHMHHARSVQPGDITEWTALDNVEPGGTFPSFITLADGGLFLFYRDGFHEADWVVQHSQDHGLTFGAKVSILEGGTPRDDQVYCEAPYVDSWYANGWGFYAGHNGDTIHVMFKYHAHTFDEHLSDENHQYQLQRKSNIYYIRRDPDGTWVSADGAPLELPVTREVAESRCRVFESWPKKGFNQVQKMLLHGISTDPDDKPCLHFSGDDLPPKLVCWQSAEQRWVELPGLPTGGRVIVQTAEHMDLYGEGKQYTSLDGGDSWREVRAVPEGIPKWGMMLHRFHPDAKMLLYDWTDQAQRIYLWGDSGLIH